MVKITGQAKKIRTYIGEASKYKGKLLYHAIVMKAKELGMTGTTVLRGIEGFGPNTRIKTTRLLDLSNDLPIVIENIDIVEYIEKLLPYLD
ncbi:MAG: DUF190 domain-containing protein [Bacillota bacterium]